MELVTNCFGEPLRDIIKSRKTGEVVLLNEAEQMQANYWQRIANNLGFDIPITTMTTIVKEISEQKFYTVAPALFVPIVIGNGAWSDQLLTYLSYSLADDFETGNLNNGADNTRLASADSGVNSLSVPTIPWAKKIGWNLIQLQQAAKAGSWDLISAKEESRKKNWDLGIQKIAFLGSATNGAVKGLYNQAGVTVDTTTLTGAISALDAASLSTFIEQVLNVYRINNAHTAWPTHFILPESDYLGLAAPSASGFPIISKMELMMQTFKVMTGNANFQILPCVYGMPQNNNLSVNKYILLNYDQKSVRMDIPVDYANTLANSLDNFSFQNAAYGQYTGVLAYRPLEMYYFQY